LRPSAYNQAVALEDTSFRLGPALARPGETRPRGTGRRETRPRATGRRETRPRATGRRGTLPAVLVTLRPRQWIKNGLVIAAAGAAGALGHDDVPVRVALTCVAFCLLASGLYAINDVLDAPEDRLHPRKRHRPVAAGELSPLLANSLALVLVATGLTLCFLVRPTVAVVGAGYVALTVSYATIWRHVVLLDIVAIAGGFVLRAVAGGVAAPVALSRWFVLVVTCAAVFVAAGKRRAELGRTEATGEGRRVLGHYSTRGLGLILAVSASVAVAAYCVWAFELPAVHGVPWRPLTIVPVAAALLRYAWLVRAGHGEAPEDLALGDAPLALAGFAWLVLFALGVHAAV
jgi:decaprenyl-phosphate phosphoribosyltransferase